MAALASFTSWLLHFRFNAYSGLFQHTTKISVMQTNESEEAENPFELLPDFVLAMIMYMLTTSDLLNAMVLTCFHDPLSLTFQRLFAKGGCSSHNTNPLCGKTGLYVFTCNQQDSLKCAVHFRKRTFLCNIWKQQVTILETLVLRAFREHFNPTLHSHHLIFRVCCFVKHLSHNR